jgi:hypothetical protein
MTECTSLPRFAMIYHLSKDVARNRADTQPTLPAVVNAAVAARSGILPSVPKPKKVLTNWSVV